MQSKKIISNQICWHPCPSPNGKKIVYTTVQNGNIDIFIYDLTKNQYEQITTNQETDHHPIWSPDGKMIIIESKRSGSFDIYEYDLNGGKIKPLIITPEYDGHACFSPDGNYLTYSHGPPGKRNIIIRKISDGQEFALTKEYDNSWPDWSDENIIVFVSNRGGNMNLYMIDISDMVQNKGKT